ncbi:unnamed protein product, partial [Discosporangium mesarthrocarpum]
MPGLGRLTLTLHEARGLPKPSNILSTLDAYVWVKLDNAPVRSHLTSDSPLELERKTSVEKDTTSPAWEESHVFRCNPGWSCTLEVRKQGFLSDSIVGATQLVVGRDKDGWYVLTDEGGQVAGEIRLSLEFQCERRLTASVAESLPGRVSTAGMNDLSQPLGGAVQKTLPAMPEELRKLIRESRGTMDRCTEDALLEACAIFETEGTRSGSLIMEVD